MDYDSPVSSITSDMSNDVDNTLDNNEVEKISQLPELVNDTVEEREWSDGDLQSDVDEDDNEDDVWRGE